MLKVVQCEVENPEDGDRAEMMITTGGGAGDTKDSDRAGVLTHCWHFNNDKKR
jgi:hypothetical protein